LIKELYPTSKKHSPFATILTCMDARIAPEILFDQKVGGLLSLRVAGNLVNEDILGSLELGASLLGSKLIVVLGHSECGAINAAISQKKGGHIGPLLRAFQSPIEQVQRELAMDHQVAGKEQFINRVAEKNVIYSLLQIREKSSLLSSMENEGHLVIVGGIYDVKTGQVRFLLKN